jgi:aminopeptidase N
MWRRGQEHLTDEYVQRYFDEVAGTASIRSGWVLADAAREFFPRLALAPETVSGAERVLADDALDLSLRRALVDSLDQLRRDLRAREVFPPAGR